MTSIPQLSFPCDSGHTSTLTDPVIGGISEAYGRTPAQVMLRRQLQQGRSAIAESFDVFDFDLTAEQLAAGKRGGREPADVSLETCNREIPEA